MRFPLTVALLLPLSAPVWAQTQNNGNSVIAVPLPPPVVAAPSTPVAPVAPLAPPPPGLVQTPAPPSAPAGLAPGAAPTGATPGAPAAPAAPPDAMPVIPNDWVPGTKVTLGVLNEIDGGTSQVSIPVGGQTEIGDLQVSVQACDIRPPTELPDAAIFLTVTQQGGDASGTTLYRGWMLRSEPGATVVGDASETFRVVGCS